MFRSRIPPRLSALLGCLAAVVLCWIALGPVQGAYWRWRFERGSTDEQMNAEAYFVRRGRSAVPLLIDYLDHPDANVRALSAHGLGYLDDGRAVEPLIARLDEEEEARTVREASAVALGRLRDYRAGPALMRALDSDFPYLRCFGSLSLTRITGQTFYTDRPAWEHWWNRQPDLRPIEPRPRPEGSAFSLTTEELAKRHFHKAVRGTAQDNIPAILEPKWTTPKDALLGRLLDDESLVFGIPGPGGPRVFPFKFLEYHQVVNFVLGGRPSVLMVSPLGGYATAFYSDLEAGNLTFGVSGHLHHASLVPYDHQTESFWNPVDGVGLLGRLSGQRLERIPVVPCTWKVWKKRYPKTLALSAESYKGGLLLDSYLMPLYPGYAESDRLLAPMETPDEGRDIPVKERVIGLRIGETCRAYPVSELEKAGGLVEVRLAEGHFKVQWDPEQKLMVARYRDGRFLPIVPAYWFAWHAYHPETEVFRAD